MVHEEQMLTHMQLFLSQSQILTIDMSGYDCPSAYGSILNDSAIAQSFRMIRVIMVSSDTMIKLNGPIIQLGRRRLTNSISDSGSL